MYKARQNNSVVEIAFLTILAIGAAQVRGAEGDVLAVIRAGVGSSENSIVNIAFDYTIEHRLSPAWRDRELDVIGKDTDGGMSEADKAARAAAIEHTLRMGKAVFEGPRFNISSKVVVASNGEVIHDDISGWDGAALVKLDMKEDRGIVSKELEARGSDLTFDPRAFPMLFIDGQTLSSALQSRDRMVSVVGTEDVNGITCYVIELNKTFKTPEGIQRQARERCWIASSQGFLVKKAIAYSTKYPDKPISFTECELTKVVDGVWYYSKVVFTSYPLFSATPDVKSVLELKNVSVNRQLDGKAFTPDITKVRKVYDSVRHEWIRDEK